MRIQMSSEAVVAVLDREEQEQKGQQALLRIVH